MARNIQAKLEAEADKKGLEGEERKRYIGGAWNHIRGKDERSRWRDSQEQKHLSRYFGTVHEVREHKARGSVVIRQGKQYYELPRGEYDRLVEAGREAYVHDHKKVRDIERENEREQRALSREKRRIEKEIERAEELKRRAADRDEQVRARAEARAIALYERELAIEKREAEREARKRARQEQAYKAAQQRDIGTFEREQDADVRAIIAAGGGIKPTYDKTTGKMRDAGEYRALPAAVKSKKGRLTMDDAARNINAEMPWLGIDTSQDLQDYFAGRTERRYRKLAERQAQHAQVEAAHDEPEAPAADWGDVFGEAQPLPKEAPAGTAPDLFGGDTSTAQKRSHKHVYEPWRSDWRYMRCTKCGEMKASTFTSKVDR